MLGFVSSMIAPAALQLAALSVMTWMTLYGLIDSMVLIKASANIDASFEPIRVVMG